MATSVQNIHHISLYDTFFSISTVIFQENQMKLSIFTKKIAIVSHFLNSVKTELFFSNDGSRSHKWNKNIHTSPYLFPSHFSLRAFIWDKSKLWHQTIISRICLDFTDGKYLTRYHVLLSVRITNCRTQFGLFLSWTLQGHL